MSPLEQMAATLKNTQIYPSKIRIEPNDIIVKKIFNLNESQFSDILDGSNAIVTEKQQHKKYGEITTPLNLENSKGYADNNPLTEFDRAVLGVCISEFAVGNPYTTPAIILRALTGKIGNQNVRPMKNQAEAIHYSISKLMSTHIKVNNREAFKKLNYYNKDGHIVVIKESAVLPACLVYAKINGQVVDDILFFDRESPLFTLTDQKDQIIRYDSTLLDVPNQNNTPLIITLKNYTMRRIAEIKLHKQMSQSLTFDDIFKKCRIENADSLKKAEARTNVLKLFENLKRRKFIHSYKIQKRGVLIYAINFS